MKILWDLIPTLGEEENKNDSSIERALTDMAAQVPQKEWDKLPVDLTDNLDHYIYDTPKENHPLIYRDLRDIPDHTPLTDIERDELKCEIAEQKFEERRDKE